MGTPQVTFYGSSSFTLSQGCYHSLVSSSWCPSSLSRSWTTGVPSPSRIPSRPKPWDMMGTKPQGEMKLLACVDSKPRTLSRTHLMVGSPPGGMLRFGQIAVSRPVGSAELSPGYHGARVSCVGIPDLCGLSLLGSRIPAPGLLWDGSGMVSAVQLSLHLPRQPLPVFTLFLPLHISVLMGAKHTKHGYPRSSVK